jgi:hypothetical protein
MSVYGDWQAATISAGEYESSAIDLGRDYDHLSMEIPEMDDACKLYLKVAETLAGTYYELDKDSMDEDELFNRADVYRLGGWRYVKVVITDTQPNDKAIRVRGMRY